MKRKPETELDKIEPGHLDEGESEVKKLLGWPGRRSPPIVLRTMARTANRKSIPAAKSPAPLALKASTLTRYAAVLKGGSVSTFHFKQSKIKRPRTFSIPRSVARGERVLVHPTGPDIADVRKLDGSRYHDAHHVWTLPKGHPFLKSRKGKELTSGKNFAARDRWRNGPNVVRDANDGASHQSYIDRANCSDQKLRAEIEHDSLGALILGNLGPTLEDRKMFWTAIAENESRQGAILQRRIIAELPHWITPSGRRNIVKNFARIIEDKHLGWSAAVHLPSVRQGSDQRNIHVHFDYFDRPFVSKEIAELVKLKGFSKAEHVNVFSKSKDRSADGPNWIKEMRKHFAECANEEIAKHAERTGSIPVRVFHPGSNESLGIESGSPQKHLGPKGTALLRSGYLTRDARHNLDAANSEMDAQEDVIWTRYELALKRLLELIAVVPDTPPSPVVMRPPSQVALRDFFTTIHLIENDCERIVASSEAFGRSRGAIYADLASPEALEAIRSTQRGVIDRQSLNRCMPTVLELVISALDDIARKSPADVKVQTTISQRKLDLLQVETQRLGNTPNGIRISSLKDVIYYRRLLQVSVMKGLSALEASVVALEKQVDECGNYARRWKDECDLEATTSVLANSQTVPMVSTAGDSSTSNSPVLPTDCATARPTNAQTGDAPRDIAGDNPTERSSHSEAIAGAVGKFAWRAIRNLFGGLRNDERSAPRPDEPIAGSHSAARTETSKAAAPDAAKDIPSKRASDHPQANETADSISDRSVKIESDAPTGNALTHDKLKFTAEGPGRNEVAHLVARARTMSDPEILAAYVVTMKSYVEAAAIFKRRPGGVTSENARALAYGIKVIREEAAARGLDLKIAVPDDATRRSSGSDGSRSIERGSRGR